MLARYAVFVLSLLERPCASCSAAIALAAVTPLGVAPVATSLFPVINFISSIFRFSISSALFWIPLTWICRMLVSPSPPPACTHGRLQSANSSSLIAPSLCTKNLGVLVTTAF